MDWPPPYQIRKSPRAKRLQLQFTPEKGLEVVVPQRMRSFSLDLFLHEHREWITKVLQQPRPAPVVITTPQTLDLLSLDERWHISYEKKISTQIRLNQHQSDRHLLLSGNIDELPLVQKKLKTWLLTHAKTHLLSQLESLSLQTGLRYQQARILAQKSRWGSCNAKGHITLNCQLLFLPPLLVQHILLHELCHTRHLNHSSAFWRLLATHDPLAHQNRRLARNAQHYIPHWLMLY
jgi:predicted metal-dependent hydrolase